jgi:Na+/H+-dicarboxylate symporter
MADNNRTNMNLVLTFVIAAGAFLALYIIPLSSLSPIPPAVIQLTRTLLLFLAAYLLFERLFTMNLFTKILLGMVIGALAGLIFQSTISEVKPIGLAFIRLIKMIVVPLVLASLVVGTASLGDIKKMGRIGTKTLAYYLAYTAFAIFLGLAFANVLKPGSGISPDLRTELMQSYGGEAGAKITQIREQSGVIDTLLNIIPNNPFEALGMGKMLQVILFAIFLGIALTLISKEKKAPVLAFFEGINDAMIKIVLIVIRIAPYGVLALIADAVGNFGFEIIVSLLKYTLITIGGLLFLSLTYPLVVNFFSGMKPLTFARGIRPAQIIAFSTSSSSATLPVTMESCEDNLGVSKEISSFVLPIGATVNMDGTALYQGVAAVFIAQVYGIGLGVGDQLLIVLTATLASIGAAGAPGVGMLMLVIVLEQVGIPIEGIALVLAVERILDMFRTVINITSDASAAVIIASTEEQLGPAQIETTASVR